MQLHPLSILIVISGLFAGLAQAEMAVPAPMTTRLPNIKASLDDGFFSLAEQQARGVLRAGASAVETQEAVLLLAQALWGQKRYSEMLDLLAPYNGEAGFIYWRARAHFELKRDEVGLRVLSQGEKGWQESRYAPSVLRLKGHIEQRLQKLEAAAATFQQFSDQFPDHAERLENQFDWAQVLILQKKLPEAISLYEVLATDSGANSMHRAQLKLAHVLYTQSATENLSRARTLLSGLATNSNVRLVYRIDAWVDLAGLEELAGDPAAATAALREAVALSPDVRQRVPLRMSLAQMHLRQGDTAGALRLLEQCRAEAPDEVMAAALQLEKADALLQAQRFLEAHDAYQVYLEVSDDTEGLGRAYFGKGRSLWTLARYAEAATAFDKAEKGLSNSTAKRVALFKAGDAYYRAEKFGRAEKRYRLFSVEFPQDGNVPNALYQQGLSLSKIDRRTEALSIYQSLETKYPESPFAEKAALGVADILRTSEQWEAALDKYTQIGEKYPNGSAAAISLHQRGLLLYRLGRYADAQQAFERVISNHAESEYAPQASYMRGFCLYLQGKTEEAVQTCLDFIHQYPDSEWTPEVIFWLAEQYYNQGEYAQAEPLFMRISSDFKGHKLASRALYWAGRIAAIQDNYVVAIERYSRVAKLYPESDVLPQTRFAQGDALSALGEFSRAILAFEEIIKNYPESYLVNTAWGRKGDCQFSLAVESPARYAEAMASYQTILDRTSTSLALKLQAEYKVGRCLEKTNIPDQAFNRYMSVVYTFINENMERSPYRVLWFTRAAFGAAGLKEKERAWLEAVSIYQRVVEAGVPAQDEAANRIEKIKKDNWLLFEQAEGG